VSNKYTINGAAADVGTYLFYIKLTNGYNLTNTYNLKVIIKEKKVPHSNSSGRIEHNKPTPTPTQISQPTPS
jgi:hypothetical protein